MESTTSTGTALKALTISPYIKRQHVGSTFHSTQNMMKTVELILGAAHNVVVRFHANDVRLSFTDAVQSGRDEAITVEPESAGQALRGKTGQPALASAKVRFDVPDAAPSDQLNRILWGQVRGWNTPYPEVNRGAFTPLSAEIEDEHRQEAEGPIAISRNHGNDGHATIVGSHAHSSTCSP